MNTYSELLTNIGTWLNRSDLTTYAPTFVQLAEARLNRVLRTSSQYTRSQLTSSDNYITLPSDFLEFKSLRLISPKERDLIEIAAHQMDEVNDTNFIASLEDKQARYYVYHGDNLRILPTPLESQTYEMNYYAKVPALSASNTSNWLLTQAPDAYLYHSLVAATPFLGEDERLPVWGQLANQATGEIQAADDRRRVKGSRHRLGFRPVGSTLTSRLKA